MVKASFKKYTLQFKQASGTSRGVLLKKETWFLVLENETKWGIGECGLLRGLSIDDVPEYESILKWVCENINKGEDFLWNRLIHFPSIQFGIEQAFLSLNSENPFILFPSDFTNSKVGIPINGLVWMGEVAFMKSQIQEKIDAGFSCVKMKIGAIDFDAEIKLLSDIREQFSANQIELRVDANGAFSQANAKEKLAILARLDIHSIEQPIKQGQEKEMGALCKESALPIALDEELIGVYTISKKKELLQRIQPKYLILKPSLVGGFRGCKEWITLANELQIGWWVTSALESNIGLNAIAQWTYTLNNKMPQGLGTGSLFTNNIEAPLTVKEGELWYLPINKWDQKLISEICI